MDSSDLLLRLTLLGLPKKQWMNLKNKVAFKADSIDIIQIRSKNNKLIVKAILLLIIRLLTKLMTEIGFKLYID